MSIQSMHTSKDKDFEANLPSPLDHLSSCLAEEMKQVNRVILENLESDVALIPQLASYLISAGGKRIRPLLTLSTTRLLEGDIEKSYALSAAVEFIHTATLLHDDIIDGSEERRGQKAANLVFGNTASVLVGDFLFARAFKLMVTTGSIDVLDVLSDTSAIITQGEVLQMQMSGDASLTWEQYLEIIYAKTGALFAAACEVSPLISNKPELRAQLSAYGKNLGLAFQIIDDLLDYQADERVLGKKLGDDFREGKLTAPILIALQDATPKDKNTLKTLFTSEDFSDKALQEVQAILKSCDALEKTKKVAQNYAQEAQNALKTIETSDTKILSHLIALPEFVLNRGT